MLGEQKYLSPLHTSAEITSTMVLTWKHPFSALIAGSSGSGKTVFVSRLLKFKDQIINTPIKEVIWCYSEWQSTYNTMKNVRFHKGLLQLDEFPTTSDPRLVIFDDLMTECDQSVVTFFTKGRHRNMSVIFLTQNLFYQGKGSRDISLNCSYIVAFKNPRDKAQIQALARQIWPADPKFVQESYESATSEPHSYILFDFKQSTPEDQRVQTCVFPDDPHHFVYVPSKYKKITNH